MSVVAEVNHPRKKRKFLWKKDSVDEILDWMNINCLQAIRSVTKEIAESIKDAFFQDEEQVTVVVIQTKFQNLRKQYKASGEILNGIRPVPVDLNLSVREAALKECPYYFKMQELNQKYETQLKAQDAQLYQSSHLHMSENMSESNLHPSNMTNSPFSRGVMTASGSSSSSSSHTKSNSIGYS